MQELDNGRLIATLAENVSVQSDKIDILQKEIQTLVAELKSLRAKIYNVVLAIEND